MQTWQSFKEEILKNTEVKREYDALAPQFELASKLIELRLKRKLSQAALAKKMGTNQSAIARLESGSYNPSIKLLAKVAAATDATMNIEFHPSR